MNELQKGLGVMRENYQRSEREKSELEMVNERLVMEGMMRKKQEGERMQEVVK